MSRWDALKVALHAMFLPKPWDEPDEDDVSPAAFRQWVAGRPQAPRAVQSGLSVPIRKRWEVT